MRPIRITPPTVTPVSLTETRDHLRVDATDEDDLIQLYLDAAIAHLDGYQGILGRCMINQTWGLTFDAPKSGLIALPFPDVSGVTANDADGQPIAGVTLRECSSGAVADVGTARVAEMDIVAGFGPAETDVPRALKAAILLHVGAMYEYRSAVSDAATVLPLGYHALVAPYRWLRV